MIPVILCKTFSISSIFTSSPPLRISYQRRHLIRNSELNEKLIPCEFAVSNGSDINDEKYRKFGFYSGQRLLNAPTNAWFQWLTFPLNNNPEYPVQLGFWVDNHSGDVRMYTRALTDVSDAHAWKNWVEIATKLYVDNKINIEKTNFIISSTTVEFQGLNAVINKNIVSCYLKIKIKSALQNNYIGTIKAPYIPYLQQVFSTLHASGSASYQAQGTIWIDGNGVVTTYGLSTGETYYAYLSWIIK